MKVIGLFLLCFLNIHLAQCQDSTAQENGAGKVDSISGEPIYISVDVNPSFPGGRKNLIKYLSKNLRYPAKARNNKIEGRVIVQFVVARDGSVRNVTILESVEETLDAEAKRVIREMPAWVPGVKNGENVNVYLVLPVSFYISSDNSNIHLN